MWPILWSLHKKWSSSKVWRKKRGRSGVDTKLILSGICLIGATNMKSKKISKKVKEVNQQAGRTKLLEETPKASGAVYLLKRTKALETTSTGLKDHNKAPQSHNISTSQECSGEHRHITVTMDNQEEKKTAVYNQVKTTASPRTD